MAGLKRAGIIFDFDDTLVYSHEQFLLAEKSFVTRMQELKLYDDDLLTNLRERDIANVRQAGYLAAECFPLAFLQTYESYCGKYNRIPNAGEMRMLLLLGWQPYINPPREMEGARELLEHLRSHESGKLHLILYTQGEPKIQQQRLNICGFFHYFDAVKIVREKNDDELQVLLQEQPLEPALTWYVGNSMRADINPAIRAGLKAVHLAVNDWSYEEEEPCGFYHSISHLEEFAVLLKNEGAVR